MKAAVLIGFGGIDQLEVRDMPEPKTGGAPMQKLLDKVRRGGSVGTVVGEPGARERGLEVRHVWAHPDADRLAALLRAVAEGALVIPITKRFSLSQIREAQQSAQQGSGGKVLVQM